MPPSSLTVEQLAALVRSGEHASLIADAAHHGVLGLLAYAAGPDAPTDLATLRRRLMLEEGVRAAETRRVVDALGAAGVRTVLLKGAALAYTHYPEPWCRTRADLDVLVPRAERGVAGDVLKAMGYRAGDLVSGVWLMQQDLWEREVLPGEPHMVDVHVELTNRAFFAAHLPAVDLLERAVPAPFAGAHAWQLDPADALLFSCVHRVAHHSRDARLVWSSDMTRQAAALTPPDVEQLVARASRYGLSSICAHELTSARAVWGGRDGALADEVLTTLDRAGHCDAGRAFVRGGRSAAGDLWLDLQALPRWHDRAQLVREHLFPPRDFMLRQPGVTPGNLLWSYARRIAMGALTFGR